MSGHEEVASPESVPLLVITGPVGAGKTAVAAALSDLLDDVAIPHAVVDMDWLRACYPRPTHDRFNVALGLRNLAALWENYRMAGASRLIIADVVETRAGRMRYLTAVPTAQLIVVRLVATLPTLRRRLETRESGASLAWHQNRAAELTEIMDRNQIEDLRVDTDDKTIGEVAREVAHRIGWL